VKISSKPSAEDEEVFYKHLWFYKAANPKTWHPPEGVFMATHLVKSDREYPTMLRSGCEGQYPAWCEKNVLSSSGYLFASPQSKKRGVIRVNSTKEPEFLLAILDIETPGEGLTPGILAIFSPKATIPRCHIPVDFPDTSFYYYIYGKWHLNAVFSVSSDKYLVWIEANGEEWDFDTFITFSSDCKFWQRKDYQIHINKPDENCEEPSPEKAELFKVSEEGKIVVLNKKYKCHSAKVEEYVPHPPLPRKSVRETAR
jgi:hypothetical protein